MALPYRRLYDPPLRRTGSPGTAATAPDPCPRRRPSVPTVPHFGGTFLDLVPEVSTLSQTLDWNEIVLKNI